jgi:hypothetical protein
MKFFTFLSIAALLLAPSTVLAGNGPKGGPSFADYEWTEIVATDFLTVERWEPRAGLEAVVLDGDFFVLGGRTPNPWVPPLEGGPIPGDSTLWGDVWRSGDRGENWEMVLATDDDHHWKARAYHEVVVLDDVMYLIGGQNFPLIDNPDCIDNPFCFPTKIPVSEFFNDVWSSTDGVNWTLMTDEAFDIGRAGHSAIVFRDKIFVMGGSYNDDSIIDPDAQRVLLNDVWSSPDGVEWTQVTAQAPWPARAGAALVVKNGYLWLIGGERAFFGFGAYFNDVWRTKDGETWEQVTPEADFPPRPGHTCDVLKNTIVCFGGFGFNEAAFSPACPPFDPSNPPEPGSVCDPNLPSNPMDIWVSKDGANWEELSDAPWNAVTPADIKYDYDTVVAPAGRDGRGQAIYTFGGDRETFDFFDPTQWLNVDNDVWRFSLPKD